MEINEDTIAQDGTLRPTYAEVNLTRLTANYHAVKARVAPARIMVILKANAYGHGLLPVARHLAQLGADYFGVAVRNECFAVINASYMKKVRSVNEFK